MEVWHWLLWLALLPIAMSCDILAVAVIGVLRSHATSLDTLLASLLTSSLLGAVLVCVYALMEVVDTVDWTVQACDAYVWAYATVHMAGLLSVVCLSIDRLLLLHTRGRLISFSTSTLVTRNIKMTINFDGYGHRGSQSLHVAICCLWLVAAVMGIVPVLGWRDITDIGDVVDREEYTSACSPLPHRGHQALAVTLAILQLTSLLVCGVSLGDVYCYIRYFTTHLMFAIPPSKNHMLPDASPGDVVLSRLRRQPGSVDITEGTLTAQEAMRSCHLVCAVVATVFLLHHLPYTALCLMSAWQEVAPASDLALVAGYLPLCQALILPHLLWSLNARYRAGLWCLLCCTSYTEQNDSDIKLKAYQHKFSSGGNMGDIFTLRIPSNDIPDDIGSSELNEDRAQDVVNSHTSNVEAVIESRIVLAENDNKIHELTLDANVAKSSDDSGNGVRRRSSGSSVVYAVIQKQKVGLENDVSHPVKGTYSPQPCSSKSSVLKRSQSDIKQNDSLKKNGTLMRSHSSSSDKRRHFMTRALTDDEYIRRTSDPLLSSPESVRERQRDSTLDLQPSTLSNLTIIQSTADIADNNIIDHKDEINNITHQFDDADNIMNVISETDGNIVMRGGSSTTEEDDWSEKEHGTDMDSSHNGGSYKDVDDHDAVMSSSDNEGYVKIIPEDEKKVHDNIAKTNNETLSNIMGDPGGMNNLFNNYLSDKHMYSDNKDVHVHKIVSSESGSFHESTAAGSHTDSEHGSSIQLNGSDAPENDLDGHDGDVTSQRGQREDGIPGVMADPSNNSLNESARVSPWPLVGSSTSRDVDHHQSQVVVQSGGKLTRESSQRSVANLDKNEHVTDAVQYMATDDNSIKAMSEIIVNSAELDKEVEMITLNHGTAFRGNYANNLDPADSSMDFLSSNSPWDVYKVRTTRSPSPRLPIGEDGDELLRTEFSLAATQRSATDIDALLRARHQGTVIGRFPQTYSPGGEHSDYLDDAELV